MAANENGASDSSRTGIASGAPAISRIAEVGGGRCYRNRWRLTGLMFMSVGIFCFFNSILFGQLERYYPSLPTIFTWLGAVVISLLIVFVKKSHKPANLSKYEKYINSFVLILFSAGTAMVEKATDDTEKFLNEGKEGNAIDGFGILAKFCFSLVALSMYNIHEIGFEYGVFTYFLWCCSVQLLEVHWAFLFLIFVVTITFFRHHY